MYEKHVKPAGTEEVLFVHPFPLLHDRAIRRNVSIVGWASRKHLSCVSTVSFQSRTGITRKQGLVLGAFSVSIPWVLAHR
ncbi:hypothetical protein LCGC14_1846070 [marine sediment metagenome]|uniref:Uncharacterized protein n=1 Tax=marine sediment metagenome TaxID=412755 RepID=A0A0F9H036_9ZZZZ